jgi:TolB-like protein/tetratricopeptide (TPR) repeat protein
VKTVSQPIRSESEINEATALLGQEQGSGLIAMTGVNVAARVEAECEPGGVYVSANAFEQMRSKTSFVFDDMGERSLKNIDRPVRVYSVRASEPRVAVSGEQQVSIAGFQQTRIPLALPDKPSIAVLPFQNMSGDPEQEYFADGVVEEIITALSKFESLFVIARTSSFTYKGRNVDVKQIGRELGVRYILDGSVRKSGGRVRITGQLIDTTDSGHIWADRFDGPVEDIFELQDRCAASVTNVIAPRLEELEVQRARQKRTSHLGAYDHYLRGLADLYHWQHQANEKALNSFRHSIALDPQYASPYAGAVLCFVQRKANGWPTPMEEAVGEVFHFAERAAELGKSDAECLAYSGAALAYFGDRVDRGARLIARALEINPNFAPAWHYSAWIHIWSGQAVIAIEHLNRCLRLNPRDPLIFNVQSALAHAYFYAGLYQEAMSSASAALAERPSFANALRILAASAACAGRQHEAAAAMKLLRETLPDLRISNLKNLLGPYSLDDIARYEDALRIAGPTDLFADPSNNDTSLRSASGAFR